MSQNKLFDALMADDEAEITRLCQDQEVRRDINKAVSNSRIFLSSPFIEMYFPCVLYACVKSKIHIVKLLVSSGADVLCKSHKGYTALYYACVSKVDVIEKVEYLLQLDQSLLGAVDWLGGTALHVATGNADIEVMKYLIGAGGDVRQSLYYACGSKVNALEKVEYLLELDPTLARTSNGDGETALHAASENDNGDVVNTPIKHGADITKCTSFGQTALHVKLVHILMSHGADIEAKTKLGSTPLHRAAYTSNTDCVQALVHQHNADVNAQNNDGDTPLHYTCNELWKGTCIATVRTLIAVPTCDVNVKNRNNRTALDIASRRGNKSAVTFLRDAERIQRQIATKDIASLVAEEDLETLRVIRSAFCCRASKSIKHSQEDRIAAALIPSCADEFPDDVFIAQQTTANGSCLFNAVSLSIIGDESLAPKLREQCAAELFINADRYATLPALNKKTAGGSGDFSFSMSLSAEPFQSFTRADNFSNHSKTEAVKNEAQMVAKGAWSSLIQIAALATVTGRCISSLYPTAYTDSSGMKTLRPIFQQVFQPLSNAKCCSTCDTKRGTFGSTTFVLWTNTEPKKLNPNHFVCLLKVSQEEAAKYSSHQPDMQIMDLTEDHDVPGTSVNPVRPDLLEGTAIEENDVDLKPDYLVNSDEQRQSASNQHSSISDVNQSQTAPVNQYITDPIFGHVPNPLNYPEQLFMDHRTDGTTDQQTVPGYKFKTHITNKHLIDQTNNSTPDRCTNSAMDMPGTSFQLSSPDYPEENGGFMTMLLSPPSVNSNQVLSPTSLVDPDGNHSHENHSQENHFHENHSQENHFHENSSMQSYNQFIDKHAGVQQYYKAPSVLTPAAAPTPATAPTPAAAPTPATSPTPATTPTPATAPTKATIPTPATPRTPAPESELTLQRTRQTAPAPSVAPDAIPTPAETPDVSQAQTSHSVTSQLDNNDVTGGSDNVSGVVTDNNGRDIGAKKQTSKKRKSKARKQPQPDLESRMEDMATKFQTFQEFQEKTETELKRLTKENQQLKRKATQSKCVTDIVVEMKRCTRALEASQGDSDVSVDDDAEEMQANEEERRADGEAEVNDVNTEGATRDVNKPVKKTPKAAQSSKTKTSRKREPSSTSSSPTCDVCGDVFTRNSSLSRHKQQKHDNDGRTYNCDECSKKYKLEKSLREHKMAVHSEQLYKCTSCDRKYGTSMGLRNHMSTHTGKYSYECPMCSYKTNYKSDYEHHESVKHSREPQFTCAGCSKTFSHKSNFAAHNKICKAKKRLYIVL